MISRRLQDQINEQIKNELESAYLYAAMVAYFKAEGLDGMAHWMAVQTKEEIGHAKKFFDYLFERGGVAELKPLGLIKNKWASPLEAFQDAYEHEKFITAKINELVELALAEKDYAARSFLDWYVDEQVEEEDSVLKVVQLLERIGSSGQGLVMIDRELGKRED
jgi:ferritin